MSLRFVLFLLAVLFGLLPAQAGFFFQGEAASAGLHGWQVAKLGGGGFITGGCIFNDNNKAIRTDVFGGYQKTGTNSLVQYVTDTTMPSALAVVGGGQGVYEIACSPSNSNDATMIYDGYLLYTTNLLCVSSGQSCATWTIETNFTQLTDAIANGGNNRLWGHFVRGDPAAANLYVIGTASEGVFLYNRSTNTVTAVSHASVPVAGAAPGGSNNATTVVDYDPTSSTSGGYTHGIAACPYSKNVYLSTDGGTTWAVSSGGTAPTLC